MSVEMAFYPGHCMHHLFHSRIQEKWSGSDEFYDHLISKSLLSRTLLHSLLHFALSSKIPSKLCDGVEFNRSKIHHMDKVSLELIGNFEQFATAVLQTVVICTKRCLSSQDHFLWICSRNKCMKGPFQHMSGINSTTVNSVNHKVLLDIKEKALYKWLS